MKKRVRDSKFELLRILSMVFIIASHFSVEGNWLINKHNFFYLYLFQPLGQVGVYCFVMISGYFLSKREYSLFDMKIRIVKLWLRVLLVSWTILLICFFTKISVINISSLIKAIFPVIFQQYWFITSFIVLMLFVPILNLMISKFSRKEFFYYILIFVFITVILPRIPKFNVWPIGNILSAGILITIYLIAGYIRKYDVQVKKNKLIVIMILFLGLEYASMYLIGKFTIVKASIYLTYGFLPLIVAICLFLFVKEKPKFYNKQINWIASSVLMAYLVTEHTLFREFLWKNILNFRLYQNNVFFVILLGILVSFSIVLLFSLVDKLYERLTNKIISFFYSSK